MVRTILEHTLFGFFIFLSAVWWDFYHDGLLKNDEDNFFKMHSDSDLKKNLKIETNFRFLIFNVAFIFTETSDSEISSPLVNVDH